MPQAAQWLRDLFPNGDNQATEHLESRGYRLRRNWTWDASGADGYSEQDRLAIQYLIDEWDYGGIEDVCSACDGYKCIATTDNDHNGNAIEIACPVCS